jgi:fluoroquinolone resistance protein
VGVSDPLPAAFVGEDLRGRDFAGADLTERRFENCRLAGASFRRAILCGATFIGCRAWEPSAGPASDAERSSAPGEAVGSNELSSKADATAGADFAFADLREAVFQRCDVSMCRFERARGYDLLLEDCQAQGAGFGHLDTRLPIATREPLVRCALRRCNLAYADLSHVDLSGADLSGSRLVEALLDETSLRGADLSGADLNNMSGRGVILAGADLRGAVFNNLDPRELDLTGARITPEQALALLEPLGVIVGE